MQTHVIVNSLAQQSQDLSKDLDAFADRAFELQRLAKALQERSARHCVDKGVQADQTAAAAPAFILERAKRLAPFSFQPFNRRLNWKRLRALNLDKLVRDSDTRTLMEMNLELANAEIENESVYDMTEANLIKLVKVLQLLLQFQQYRLDHGQHIQQLLQEENISLAGTLQQVPQLEMGGIEEGLLGLEKEFYKVADADMDAMFTQVRVEERTGARDTVGNNVDQVKAGMDIEALGGVPPGVPGAARAAPVASAGRLVSVGTGPPGAPAVGTSARPPSVASGAVPSRPPSVASGAVPSRPPSVASGSLLSRPPSAAAGPVPLRPPSVANGSLLSRPPSAAAQEPSRPPSVASEPSYPVSGAASTASEHSRPPSLDGRPPSATRPPSALGQPPSRP